MEIAIFYRTPRPEIFPSQTHVSGMLCKYACVYQNTSWFLHM